MARAEWYPTARGVSTTYLSLSGAVVHVWPFGFEGASSETQSLELGLNERFIYRLHLRILAKIQKVMEDPGAKEAIDAYKGTKFAKNDATLTFLTQAMGSTLFMSCVAAKWDGDKPPARRQKECDGIYLMAGAAAPADIMPGVGVPGFYGGIVPSPYNLLWGMHVKYNIVEHLAKDFGSQSGDYNFDYSWWKTQRP